MFRIFLTNLGKYNEGELVGKWIDLPVDDDFESAFEDIGINDEYEEWFITDYENDYDYEIGEYDDIYELNEIAEKLEDLDEDQAQIVSVLIDNHYAQDIDDAISKLDDIIYYPGCYNMTDVAYEYVDNIVGIESLGDSTLENYFDFEHFGRELRWDDLSDIYPDEDELENMSDYELGQNYVYDIMGGISELGRETLESYFDYEAFGRDLGYESSFEEYSGGMFEIPY